MGTTTSLSLLFFLSSDKYRRTYKSCFLEVAFCSDINFETVAKWMQARSIFHVGAQNQTDSSTVTNISFTTAEVQGGGKFSVDISRPVVSPWNVRAFIFEGGVSHFALHNVLLKMANPFVDPTITINGSKSGIEFNNAAGRRDLSPSYGSIVNVTSTGGMWGYGTTQVQSAENMQFENIDGTGGVTLRLETGVGNPGK